MGRPKGSKNKPKLSSFTAIKPDNGIVKRGRGRPKKEIVIPGITPYVAQKLSIVAQQPPRNNDFYTRHKGPYILVVHRPVKNKLGLFETEWLSGRITEGEEVEREALALLADPRDSVVDVNVWSESEQQFVTIF